MWKNRYPGLWNLFVGPRYRNVGLFTLILIPNAIAALLEGVSFALMLAALSVFSGETLSFPLFHSLASMNREKLFLFLVILAVVCQAARSAIGGIALYANSLLALRIQESAQLKIYQKIFEMSFRCASQYKIGDLAEYTKTPATIVNTTIDNANKALVSFFMIRATLTIMMMLNIKLTLLTLFLLVLAGGFHKSIIKKIGRFSEGLIRSSVECSKHTMQTLQSMRTIHTYNRQEYAFHKIRQILRQIVTLSKKVYFWNNFIPSINELLGTFFVTATLLSGIWILNHKEGSLPILITFLALTHRLAIRIQMGNTALGQIVMNQGALLRLEEILSDSEKEYAPTGGAPFPGFSSNIVFHDVSLQYLAVEKPAVQNVSFEIPKGKTVAFVGASGAGKSSLLDILVRLYEPTGGIIQIDGVDLRQYSIGSWRDRLGVVSQDISIFNDTIEENIRFGSLHKTAEEIASAAKQAGLEEFIQTLPEGYQTLVGERGFRLSGGQRQRLALARALLRDPDLLILDEATSNLDSHSESLIQNALENLRSERTVLIVAHRLSTIMDADSIYVLDTGRIVEQGTHASLLAQNGAYAHFWELQKK